jgi:putative transposase
MPTRKHPAHGLLIDNNDFPIVFLTVCTKQRENWLATSDVHQLLCKVWRGANAWLVGRYVIMPDHIHLFAAPTTETRPFDNWVRFWKSQFTKAHKMSGHQWQTDHWDTRLRSWESYDTKWLYVRENPVRHRLAASADDWPFQGELNELRWD